MKGLIANEVYKEAGGDHDYCLLCRFLVSIETMREQCLEFLTLLLTLLLSEKRSLRPMKTFWTCDMEVSFRACRQRVQGKRAAFWLDFGIM